MTQQLKKRALKKRRAKGRVARRKDKECYADKYKLAMTNLVDIKREDDGSAIYVFTDKSTLRLGAKSNAPQIWTPVGYE